MWVGLGQGVYDMGGRLAQWSRENGAKDGYILAFLFGVLLAWLLLMMLWPLLAGYASVVFVAGGAAFAVGFCFWLVKWV